MEFVDDEHEKFWEEKNLIMQKYGKTDVYYKSIVYTLGICETTRSNFNKIFSIENGEINIDSVNGAFQTGTSERLQEWHLVYGIDVTMIAMKIEKKEKYQNIIIRAKYFVVVMHHTL